MAVVRHLLHAPTPPGGRLVESASGKAASTCNRRLHNNYHSASILQEPQTHLKENPMGIPNLLAKKDIAQLGPIEQVSLRIPIGVIDYADELATSLDTTRAEVLREMVIEGYKSLGHEWTVALETGAANADS